MSKVVVSQLLSTKQEEISEYKMNVGQSRKEGSLAILKKDKIGSGILSECWNWFTNGKNKQNRHVKLQDNYEKRNREGKSSSNQLNKALFGVRPAAKTDPATRLLNMSESVRLTAEEEEIKADKQKKDALYFYQQGNKTKALRELKKSKQTETRASSLMTTVEALETQISLLQQTEIQNSVANILKTCSVSSASSKNALASMEMVSDTVAETKDTVDEMQDALGELATVSGGLQFDDSELLEELESLQEAESSSNKRLDAPGNCSCEQPQLSFPSPSNNPIIGTAGKGNAISKTSETLIQHSQ